MSEAQTGHVSHHNLTLMTTEDAAILDAFLRRPELRGLIWMRLDDTKALVDTERIGALMERLKKIGYSPRFSTALPR